MNFHTSLRLTALADRVKGVRNDQIIALCKEAVAKRAPVSA